MSKVYILWYNDNEYENDTLISIHSTKESAQEEMITLLVNDDLYDDPSRFDIEEREVK